MIKNPASKKPTLIYIMSAGHSGSTLLNILLNGHSQILGMSEINALPYFIQSSVHTKAHFESPFWKQVRACFKQKTKQLLKKFPMSLNQYPPGLQANQDWLSGNQTLFECLSHTSHKQYIVDTSKVHKRLYWLAQSDLSLKVIILTKDGRSLLYSYLKKHPEAGFRGACHRYLLLNLWYGLIRLRFPGLSVLHLKYQDLATDPEKQLRRICDYIGVEFQPTMLNMDDDNYHGIQGNHQMLARVQEITLDTRWQTQLRPSHQRWFMLLFGWINRLWGYPWNYQSTSPAASK